ncbi:MAG: polyprenyl synthetase family protein [Oscillospiraceae bacterium]|nr:polyprenyl synthetase family protein [Oscillospiraceae bacterium]
MDNKQLTMDNYLKLIEEALAINGDSPLKEAVQYSLNAGGKRIRPVLTLAFCEAYGGDVRKHAPAAAAIELLHTSTLIQDDLPCMDDDDMRRGKPACHKAFSESDALLAASSMAYRAIYMLEDPRIIKAVCGYMGKVYDGQKLDLGGSPDTLRVYELKTCALIQAACVTGVIAGGGSNSAIKNAHDYGYNLGLAFQLIDDILDGEGHESAALDAEKYTREALKLLEAVPNNEFLTELTKKLLHRKN